MDQTFAQWMRQNLEPDTIRDIARHGADAGFPGLTYYTQTVALYALHEDEIWQAVEDDADSLGYSTPLALIASFGGAQHVHGDDQFRNLMVWYMAERYAYEWDDDGSLDTDPIGGDE